MVPVLADLTSSPLYYRTTNITSTETEYTYVLDFSGLYNGAASSATIISEGDEFDTAIASGDLFFSNTVVSSIATISDITLTQIVD